MTVKIKPLEWVKRDCWFCTSPFYPQGVHIVEEDGWFYPPMLYMDPTIPQKFATLEEAKQFCQEWHNKQVMELIETGG